MSKSKRRLGYFGRSSRLEPLEERIVLDTQIGTVTMPYDGYLSAAVYDSDGQIVRTLLAQFPEQAGDIPLYWDGKDQLGRTVNQSGTYTWKALFSQVNAVDQGAVGDSESGPLEHAPNEGYFVKSLATSMVPGTAGDVGGTFARNDDESYFGDTTLSQNFTLDDTITASGTLFFSDVATMHGKAFIGHFSSSTANNRREFLGLEVEEGDNNQVIGIRARINRFNGDANSDAKSNTIDLGVGTGYYNWSYTYDPNYEADNSNDEAEGALTLHIWNNAGLDQTLIAVNDASHREAGSTFDAFGMGISTMESLTGDDSDSIVKLFMNNVTYSGNSGTVDFTSDPSSIGWTGSGNTTSGNNYGWNQYSNADGSIYMTSLVEEATEINKITSDGSWVWSSNDANNFGNAADEMYTYVSRIVGNEYQIYRYFARDGGLAPFSPTSTYLVLSTDAGDPSPTNQLPYHQTSEQWRQFASPWGMAADGYRLWVSNYRDNYVKVYDRGTGSLLGQYTIAKPLAIAVDTASSGSSTVWIVNNGDRVTKITFNGTTFTPSTSITGLSDPTGLTIGGPNHHLFVAETGTTHIREYDISGTPTPAGLQIFGSKHPGGPIADDQFYWNTFGGTVSLAIDPSGILSVTDDHRVQRFYTVTGGGHTAGALYDSMFSEFAPGPIQSYNYHVDPATGHTLHYLLSNRYVYEVDPEYTNGPRAGWLGDGSWRLVERYYWGVGEENYGPGLRRTITDNGTQHDLLYQINGNMIIAYALRRPGNGRRQSSAPFGMVSIAIKLQIPIPLDQVDMFGPTPMATESSTGMAPVRAPMVKSPGQFHWGLLADSIIFLLGLMTRVTFGLWKTTI